MTRLQHRQIELVHQFEKIENWEDRYKKIIEMGKSLPQFSDEKKQDNVLVKGCQSKVWMYAHLNSDGELEFEVDSDALIVRGLLSVIMSVYSPARIDEILSHPPDFIKQLGFDSHLTPSRANGVIAVVKQIIFYATAFKVKLSQS